MSEDLENIAGDIADLTKSLEHPMGVSLFTDATKTEYKSTYQILKDISEIYDELTDKQQAQLLEKLAGKRGGQVLAGILGKENFSEVERALAEIEQSAGSADAEMSIIQDSISYKMNALKETWVGVLQEIAGRKEIGIAIDGLTSLSVALGKVVKTFGMFGSIAGGVGIYQFFNHFKDIKKYISGLSELGTVIQSIQGKGGWTEGGNFLMRDAAELDLIKEKISGLSEERARLALSTTALTNAEKEQLLVEAGFVSVNGEISAATAQRLVSEKALSEEQAQRMLSAIGITSADTAEELASKKVTKAQIEQAITSGKLTAEEGKQMISTLGLTGANGGLATSFKAVAKAAWSTMVALATNPVTWVVAAIASVGALAIALDNVRHNMSKTIEAANEANNAYKSSADEVKILNDELKTCNDRLEELKKLEESGKISLVEQEELNKLREENDELERQISLKEEEARIAAREAADQANKTLQKTVRSKYLRDEGEFLRDATLSEELDAALKQYDKYVQRIDELKKSLADKEITEEQYNSMLPDLEKERDETRAYAKELFDTIETCRLAYKNLADSGEEMSEEEVANFKAMGTAASQYYSFIKQFEKHELGRGDLISKATEGLDISKTDEDFLYKQISDYINGLDPEKLKVLLNTEFDWTTLNPREFVKKCEEILSRVGPVKVKVHTSTDRALDEFEFKDPEDESKTIKGAEKLNNYYSTMADIQDAMQKLNSGLITTAEKSDLAIKYDLASDSIEGMTKELEEYIRTEEKAATGMIDEILNDPDYTDDAELIATLEHVKELIHDSADEALSLKTNLVGGAEAINNVQNLKSGMDQIEKIYIDIQDKGQFDWSTIINNAEFESTFKSCGAAYDEFIQAVKDSPNDIKAAQDAFDKLVTRYQRNTKALYGLKQEDAKAMKDMLTGQGVTNADELIGWEFGSQEIQEQIDNLLELAEAEKTARIESAKSITNYETRKQAIKEANDSYAEELANLSAECTALQNASEDQKAYYAAKLLNQSAGDFTSMDIEQLEAIVRALGLASEAWRNYWRATKDLEAMNSGAYTYKSEWEYRNRDQLKANLEYQTSQYYDNIADQIANMGNKGGGATYGPLVKNAGGAGKEAGDAYVDAFNKELEKLKNAYERGDISLKDYLAQWKALIEKFFANNPKYAEEFANQMKSYLDAVKGYYSGAISGVTTILQGRISALQRQKDKAIKQLEKEKEAALEAYDVQIKAIEKTIKAKQKQIKQLEKEKKAIEAKKKPLEDEIKAIQDANTERERELQLQKDLYELERLQNQRTQFVLKDGQMVYQADATAARDQREQVKKDEDEQKIAALEKQIEAYDKQIELIDQRIEAINEEIELLEEEKELLEEQRAAVEEYYDKLIKETEEMFDEMIEGLEEILEKWQQLAEIETIANAWKQGGEVFEAMGLTIEDVLNDAPGAFEKFRDAWIQVLMDSENGNKQYAEGIKEWGRQNEQVIDGVVDNYKKLGTEGSTAVEPLKTPLDNATNLTKSFGDAASTASGNVGTLAENTGKLATNASEASTNVNEINGIDFAALEGKLDNLKLKLQEVVDAINGGEEGSIKAAIDALNNETNLDIIIAQFTALSDAVNAVSSALGGGGAPATNGTMGGTGMQSAGNNGAMAGAEGAAGSLASAIEALNGIKLDGEEGIIGQFEKLKEAVDAVTTAIGGGGEGEGLNGGNGGTGLHSKGSTGAKGEGGEGEGADSLISAIEAVKTTADENIGTSAGEEGETAIGDFMALATTVADEVIPKIGTGADAEGGDSLIGAMNLLPEVADNTLRASVIPAFEELLEVISDCVNQIGQIGTALEALATKSVSIPITGSSSGKYTGTATLTGLSNLNGNWGFEGGETLIAELGPELAVLPNGTYKLFDKPQLTRLPKGSVIFNALQTNEILDKKNQVKSFGKAHANGTVDGLTPLTGTALNDMLNLANSLSANSNVMRTDLGDIKRHTEEIRKTIQNVSNNNSTSTNVTFGDLNFTCNGISAPEVLNEVQNALNQTFEGMALNAYQRAMAR